MDDIIFTEKGGSYTEYEISSFRLGFFKLVLLGLVLFGWILGFHVSFDSLIDVAGVGNIDNIHLGYCLTFTCCTK